MSRYQRRVKKILIAGVITLVIAAAQNQGYLKPVVKKAVETQPGLYQVTSFADGDTFSVDMNGTTEKIRLIGVDTPETHDPRKSVQCFGQAASAFTKNLVANNRVRLEADPTNTDRDRYNRLLRYVYLPDGRLVNAEIIKQGYGFAYTYFPFTKLEEFRAYEKLAREGNLGLWGDCTPTSDQKGQFKSNDSSL